MNKTVERKDPVCQAVRRLRLALRDTQQDFAHRLGLAISTVVRYELTRPPRGKALAQLEHVSVENGLDEYAVVFRNALRKELSTGLQTAGYLRPPLAGSVGFAAWPQTPEEEAMVFDVLTVMREARVPGRPQFQAQKELKQLMNATQRARADRIEGVESGQADEDRKAAIVRLSRLGMSPAEIADRLKERGSKVEAVLAEHDKKGSEE